MTVAAAPRRRITLRSLAGGALDLGHLSSGYGVAPLALLFLLGSFTALDGEGFGLLQPLIKHDLGLNFTSFLSITSAVGTASLLLAGPLGFLADRVRRTALVGIGGILSGLAMLLTGLAGTPLAMGTARAVRGAAGDLGGIPQFSLLVDYYAVDQRVRVVTLLRVGGLVGTVLSLPLIGLMASSFGWRIPFYAMWAPTMVVSLYVMLRLPEPVRGYQERRALGVEEASARREQPHPSWTESWRMIWASRVLRYTSYSFLFLSLGGAFLALRPFYFFQIWHQSPTELAAIATVSNVADLLALLLGGGVINHIARLRPHRVFQLTAASSLITALAGAGLVLAPVLWLSVASGILFGALGTLVTVSSTALVLNVMPPRARGTAVGAFAYWAVPGLFLAPLVGSLADSQGLQQTILLGSAFPVVASIFGFMSARYYESDVRNAELSASATQAHEQSLLEGSAKLLILRQVDMHHGSVQSLFNVDLEVGDGELIAVLGTNGAGKTTLLRTIAGVSEASAGAIVFDGVDITHLPPNEIAARGIVYVQGGRSIFPTLTVRQNLSLGAWLQRDREVRRRDLERAFSHFPVLRERLDQVAGSLSSGEQQMLALSNALLTQPRLLMIDELSLGLAPAVVNRLVGIVGAINAQGTTVMVVEQSLTLALRLARRAVFMERGRVQFTGPTRELRARTDLLRSVFLRGTAAMEESGVVPMATLPTSLPRRPRAAGDDTILTVDHVSKSYGGRGALQDLSLTLRRGAILGVIGPNGAGKTTLLDIVSGFAAPDGGSVTFAGEDVTAWGADARARLGMSRRFRDSRLFPTLTVDEVLTICVQQSDEALPTATAGRAMSMTTFRPRRSRSVEEVVNGLVELLHLGRYRDAYAGDLSTGTRRLLDLAAAIAGGPQLLLLDEPASGLAQAETEELAPILRQLRRRMGCAILVVEHDINLVSGLADELVALHLGRILARGRPLDVLADDRVLTAYFGETAGEGPPGDPVDLVGTATP